MIQEDKFLDYLAVLKKTNNSLENLLVDDIAEIYLFFDYDPQSACKYYNESYESAICKYNLELYEIINFCNNETEPQGKLFINFPMIESLWHIPKECNNRGYSCLVSIEEVKIYKRFIASSFS